MICACGKKKDTILLYGEYHSKDYTGFFTACCKECHFIYFNLYKQKIDALTNVHSLTFRVFTDKEQADNHCNIGNPKLAIDTILNWIYQMKEKTLNENIDEGKINE